MVHTGSRQLGKQVCEHYEEIGLKKLNDHSQEIGDLIKNLQKAGRQAEIQAEVTKLKASFVSTSKDFPIVTGVHLDDYLHDMAIAQRYARDNRRTLASIILCCIERVTVESFSSVHNYIDVENRILRKGAIEARQGQRVVIPLNMKDGSILAVGQSNPDWNYSAPHGAGRLMSRRKAKDTIKLADYQAQMEGIYTTSVSAETLDEAPGAYKSAEDILAAIGPTVSDIVRVYPTYNFKAGE